MLRQCAQIRNGPFSYMHFYWSSIAFLPAMPPARHGGTLQLHRELCLILVRLTVNSHQAAASTVRRAFSSSTAKSDSAWLPRRCCRFRGNALDVDGGGADGHVSRALQNSQRW